VRMTSSPGGSPPEPQARIQFPQACRQTSGRLSWSWATLRRCSIRGSIAVSVERSLYAVVAGLEVFLSPDPSARFSSYALPSLSLPSPSESAGPDRRRRIDSSSPGVWAPSAASELEARFTRVCLTRHLPTSGFRTLLPVSILQHLPALFHAGTAHGVFPSGLFPPAEPSRPLGRGDPRGVGDRSSNLRRTQGATGRKRRLQGFALREDSPPAGAG
jgi:hypothetical protein